MLQNFNLKKPVTFETDALDYVTANVLLQLNKKENLHSMTFFFNKMSLKECNYKIYDKDLLIIVKIFKEWHFKIYDTADSVIILTDYKNLKYFIIIYKLNHCQVCWNEFVSEFNFNIIYWLKVINNAADTFICYTGDYLCNEKDLWNTH